MDNDGETVRTGFVEISYSIREWHIDGTQYDWVTDAGEESDMLFDDVDAAEYDFRRKF